MSDTETIDLGRLLYDAYREVNPGEPPYDVLPKLLQKTWNETAVFQNAVMNGQRRTSPGEVAYTTYCSQRGWRGVSGSILPSYERLLARDDQSRAIAEAWALAAETVLRLFRSVPDPEPFEKREGERFERIDDDPGS